MWDLNIVVTLNGADSPLWGPQLQFRCGLLALRRVEPSDPWGWGVHNGTRAALYRDWLTMTQAGATARKVLDPSVFLYNQAAPNVVDFVMLAGASLGGPCSVYDHGARPPLGAGKKELG